MVLVISVAAVIGIAILFMTISKMIRSLKDLRDTAEQIAAGELIENMIQDTGKPE